MSRNELGAALGRLMADHERIHDVDDLILLDDDEYCSSCGQIGCGWC